MWLTSLGVGCLRLHGISRMCNVPALSPTASRCCFSVKQHNSDCLHCMYKFNHSPSVCLKILNLSFGFIFFTLVMWPILSIWWLCFSTYVLAVTEEKWLIVFFLKAYLISWRKICGLIFTFWRRRLRFVFLILYLTYMILRKITLSSLKFTFEIYKMVKLTYSTRSISIICDDDLWDIWKGKTVT